MRLSVLILLTGIKRPPVCSDHCVARHMVTYNRFDCPVCLKHPYLLSTNHHISTNYSTFTLLNIWPASHEKGPSDITNSVDQDQPYTLLKTAVRIQIAYTARNVCAIDVTRVKRYRPWPDAVSKTRRLVWVYTFCICPKVPFRMTLTICRLKILLSVCTPV